MTESPEQKSLQLKTEGNQLFKAKNYKQAVEKYTEAIETCPEISVLYSNRSRCYRNLEEYEKSYEDAEMALKFDDKNIKAYFLMGESLVVLAEQSKNSQKIQTAIQKLKKSLTLCPSQGKSEFEERFIHEIYRAKKKLWLINAEQQKEKKKALRSYLTDLVENDPEIDEDQKDKLEDHIRKVADSDIEKDPSKIPKSLVCPLSNFLLINPIVNEHGYSYSKAPYLEHLKVSKQDPVTKKKIATPNLMYNNINLKKAIEAFLEKHPWAYEEPVIEK